MKKLLYDTALFAFPRILRVLSPFYGKARLMHHGRTGWKEQLQLQKLDGKKIWFHCASLGEFEQGRPLMEALKKNNPNCSVIITFFSSSGYEIRKDYKGADYICYLPFDGKKSSPDFIEILRPDLVVFIKYEFWYYYLTELKKHGIPVFSVSAIFRLDQQFFKRRGHFFREMLASFTHFFVQNEYSKKLLQSQGYDNVIVSGDTRFDRVTEICAHPKSIEEARLFKSRSKVVVIGSSWPDDMKVLYPIINNPGITCKFIIAPHEVGVRQIESLCSGLKVKYQLFSKADMSLLPEVKVLVIDNIGMLSSLYQYGEMAYIGGAFGDGLHNILEAATFGMPIVFGKGKDNQKYQEAVDLVKLKGAFEIANAEEAETVFSKFLFNDELLTKTSNISRDYVASNTGATQMIMDFLSKYL